MKKPKVRQLRAELPKVEGRLAEDFTRRFAAKTKRRPTRKGAVDLLLEERGL
jgi:hypothetical protein